MLEAERLYLDIEIRKQRARERKVERKGCDTNRLWQNHSFGAREVHHSVMSDVYAAYNEYVQCGM